MRTESSELESDLDESGLDKKKKNLSGASQVSHSNNTSYGQVPSYLVTEENESDRYIQVAVLGDGHCFGELSLISHKPRSATIKWLTDTKFAVLNKKWYEKVFYIKEKKLLAEKVTFLKNIPFL